MIRIGVSLKLLFLVSLFAFIRTTDAHVNRNGSSSDDLYKKKAQERRFSPVLFPKKSKELVLSSSFSRPFKGRQEQILDELPEVFLQILETTNYLEAFLFFLLFLYGQFHLHCWDPLYRKCIRENTWSRYLEILEMQS